MHYRREKQGILLLAAVGLAGIILLAAALGSFSFATPYQMLKENCNGSPSSILEGDNCNDTTPGSPSTAIPPVFVVIPLILALLVIYFLVRSPQFRPWLLLTLGLLLIIGYLIVAARPLPLVPEKTALVGSTLEALQVVGGTPQPTLASPLEPGTAQVTSGLVWLLSLGLAGLVLILSAAIYMFMHAYRTQTASPLVRIGASAEMAIQALEQGSDVKGVILHCYSEMLAAASEQGVNRQGYLTPAEFIHRMVQAGLPPGAVERLTHLFEAARYSPQQPTALMETEAVDCLQVVVQAAKGNL